MISGTSAGAFIAAVYAMTRETKTIESIVRRHSKNNHESRDLQVGRVGPSIGYSYTYGPSVMDPCLKLFFDLTLPVYSIFTGKVMNDRLIQIFGLNRNIEDLWIPFFCVSTDISACKMRIHNTGSVWRYVRGSMSIAGVFSPICDPVDGHYLVDGGYVNNVPADIAIKLGAKKVIAVDVSHTMTSEFSNFGDALRMVSSETFQSILWSSYTYHWWNRRYRTVREYGNL